MLSIIIPTHNRAESVARSLLALEVQKCDMPFEVVLVQDGCVDCTDERVQSLRLRYPIKSVCLPGLGAAAARNAGASAASGNLLLFMDDDIVPQPEMLNAHIRMHESSTKTAVVGPCPYGPEILVNPIDFFIRDWWKRRYEILADPNHVFTYYDCMTGNLSMPKHVFESVGGFDQAFLKDGREDYELGVRLLKSGVEFAYAPDAVGYHYPTNRPKALLNKWFIFGSADVYFAIKHPDILDSSPLRRYWALPLLTRRSLATILSLICRNPKPLFNRLGVFFERRIDRLWDSRLLKLWYLCQQIAYLMGIISTGDDLRELEHLASDKLGSSERAHVATRIEDIDLSADLPEMSRTNGFDKIVLAPRLGEKILGWADADCQSGEGSLPCREITDRVVNEVFWNAWHNIALSRNEDVSEQKAKNLAWAKFQECIRINGRPQDVCLSKIGTFAPSKTDPISFLVFSEGDFDVKNITPVLPNSQAISINTLNSNLMKRLKLILSRHAGDYVVLMKESDIIDSGWATTVQQHFTDQKVDCVITPVLLRNAESRGNELYQTFVDFDRVRYWRSVNITERFTLAHSMYDFALCNHRMVFRTPVLRSIIDRLPGHHEGFDDLTTAILRESLFQYKEIVYEPWALMWHSSPLTPDSVRSMAARHAYLVSREIASVLPTAGPGRLRALVALSKVPRIQVRRLIRSIRGLTEWPVSYVISEIMSGVRGACRGLIPIKAHYADEPVMMEDVGGTL